MIFKNAGRITDILIQRNIPHFSHSANIHFHSKETVHDQTTDRDVMQRRRDLVARKVDFIRDGIDKLIIDPLNIEQIIIIREEIGQRGIGRVGQRDQVLLGMLKEMIRIKLGGVFERLGITVTTIMRIELRTLEGGNRSAQLGSDEGGKRRNDIDQLSAIPVDPIGFVEAGLDQGGNRAGGVDKVVRPGVQGLVQKVLDLIAQLAVGRVGGGLQVGLALPVALIQAELAF